MEAAFDFLRDTSPWETSVRSIFSLDMKKDEVKIDDSGRRKYNWSKIRDYDKKLILRDFKNTLSQHAFIHCTHRLRRRIAKKKSPMNRDYVDYCCEHVEDCVVGYEETVAWGLKRFLILRYVPEGAKKAFVFSVDIDTSDIVWTSEGRTTPVKKFWR